MASPRIKGQEVEVILIANGQVQDTITTVRNFEVAAQLEILSEGYLGQTTDLKDSISKGVRGKMELHIDNNDIFNLMIAIIDKARRRTPGARINIKTTLNFPNGDKTRVVIPDAEFGEIPLNFGSRSDYGAVSLEFEASEVRYINS